MVAGIYKARDGMHFGARELEIIANNVANISTSGFKKDGLIFQSILEEVLDTEWNPIIEKAAETYNVDSNLIYGVMMAESNGNPKAVSPKGAKGLMQLMDSVSEQLGVKDPFDPETNILAGTKYLGKLLTKFGGNEKLALAAYNAGPDAVKKYDGVPPYKETIGYIEKVLDFKQNRAVKAQPTNLSPIIEFTDFREGPLQHTNASLDFAIQGKGFFAVRTPHGIKYTRCGSFELDDNGILVTHQGYPVLGEGGEILISGEKVSISRNGSIFVDDALMDRFLIQDFDAFRKWGENFFEPTGKELDSDPVTISQGYVEKSNLEPTKELVNLTEVSRRYEACQHLILVQDVTLDRVINTVGRVR